MVWYNVPKYVEHAGKKQATETVKLLQIHRGSQEMAVQLLNDAARRLDIQPTEKSPIERELLEINGALSVLAQQPGGMTAKEVEDLKKRRDYLTVLHRMGRTEDGG